MRINITGKLLTSSSEERNSLYKELADKFALDIEAAIHQKFNRSVQLSAIVGQLADQEAVKAIIRSLNVTIKSLDPIKLEANFHDTLGHWYGGSELPEELSEILQNIMDNSIKEWINSNSPREILNGILFS